MKKLIALILAGLMALTGTALAATWPEGCSPSQPYAKVDAVDLTKIMGYLILNPRAKLPVSQFCDVLEIFLPREDLTRGQGMLRLYEIMPGATEGTEVCSVDFADPQSVELRLLGEQELSDLMWGGGTCIEIHLPKSLEFGDRVHQYYVLMDEGCFLASNGAVRSLGIFNPEAWQPVIGGEYGISGLYYIDAPYVEKPLGTPEPEMAPNEGVNNMNAADGASGVDLSYQPQVVGMDGEIIESASGLFEDAAPQGAILGAEDAPAEENVAEPAAPADAAPVADAAAAGGTMATRPDKGDIVHFDLVMGGDAVYAIPYSENGSVEFETVEFTESTHVTGTVVGDDVQWGVVFLNDESDVIRAFELGR
ncbi:MAG: hypothetical protein IJ646_06965 [Clostridia bacterium]|nr:hypothetical protein [Clostridia bacterium]